ncbi:MAG: aminotransferase class I/II-fold pyridoxal phosphate-dependent enzyme [Oscillospiraceae bacterium]|nr:aminotransferase class I/II-fold pyridoxal phosphate-dependent enzyme [Oscillospiraceae bacterium]
MELIHGGDTEGYLLKTGREPLDFSSNSNPLGVPEGVIKAISEAAARADRYPDPLCRRLTAGLSEAEGVPPEHILCGNGAADLIFRLVLAVRPRNILVTAPAFAEYEKAVGTVGAGVHRFFLRKENSFDITDDIVDSIVPGIDMVFITNPNNPTGRCAGRELVFRIHEKCVKTGALLVLDECFNGFLDEPEKYSCTDLALIGGNVLILKAFTKIYGIPGVRLGYCICPDPGLLERMYEAGQPWPVSSLAQQAGIAALREGEYVKKARQIVRIQRGKMVTALRGMGFEVFEPTANYIFFKSDIPDLARRMRRLGVLIRDCSNYVGLEDGYCRVAVRGEEENAALLEALKTAIEAE